MIVQVFSVFDSKAGSFAQPFFSHTLVTGKRAFADACADPSTMLSRHPSDFALFHLGSFDDQSGFFDALVAPDNLGLAAAYRSSDNAA